MKRNLFKASIFISLLLLMLELVRWYGWRVDFEEHPPWDFITNKGNTGMLWNILLAWIAVFLGWLVYKSRNQIWRKFLSLVWILWLPNTIYLVTDIKYFRMDKTTTLLHEIVFFSLFSLLGILLYYFAVYLVWLKYKFSKKWLIFITGIAIIGVIIGRVLRWNSWDVFTDPQKILSYFASFF